MRSDLLSRSGTGGYFKFFSDQDRRSISFVFILDFFDTISVKGNYWNGNGKVIKLCRSYDIVGVPAGSTTRIETKESDGDPS